VRDIGRARLLITAGVIVLLYLAWQLWINNAVVAREQQDRVTHNSAQWSSALPTPEPTYGVAPILAHVDPGETLGNLYIPRLGASSTRAVSESVDPTRSLNRGFYGHYSKTQWPGEPGNFALAVHRSGWGTGFAQAQLLRTGDRIYLETPGGYYGYTVRNIEYVKPSSIDVLNKVPGTTLKAFPGQSIMTITTCSPQDGNVERLVTYAVLDSWRPRSAGPFEDLAPLMKKA
jgi:sortase A